MERGGVSWRASSRIVALPMRRTRSAGWIQLHARNLAPSGERLRPQFTKAAAGDQMALDIEMVVDGGMDGKEPLGRAW